MGLNRHFSSDTREGMLYEQVIRVNSTPDPTKFKILSEEIVNGYLILKVKYPDVTNYEGVKILMYDKHFDINRIKNRIDPHFLQQVIHQ